LFDKAKFKEELNILIKSNPELEWGELRNFIMNRLITDDEYIRNKSLVDEIINWYLTMREERLTAKQWYHTIDLGNGFITNGIYDHRKIFNYYGFPGDLKDKRVLDVGPADGYFSFEFERLGAKEVVAIDAYESPNLTEAKNILKSKVDYRIVDVYDLNPKELGYFDMVFCGTLLIHLSDPFRALTNIRAILSANGMLYIATLIIKLKWYLYPVNLLLNQLPLAILVKSRQHIGAVVSYWIPSIKCLREMLYKVGFDNVQEVGSFNLYENHELTGRKQNYPHVVLKAW
jgi:tRNA (mo5U34)-methyltransferase